MTTSELMPHDRALELLPWLVNGSLDDSEAAAAREHALSCIICHRELRDLEQLRQSVRTVAEEHVIPEPDMRRINRRIDEHLLHTNRWRDLLSRLSLLGQNPWRVAFVVQSFFLVALALIVLMPRPPEPAFTTLSNPVVLEDGLQLRVLFSPDLDAASVSDLLGRHALKVVDGPSRRGVYTLTTREAMSGNDYQELIVRLRERPDVLFAEDVSP